jgi:hypothetical protein
MSYQVLSILKESISLLQAIIEGSQSVILFIISAPPHTALKVYIRIGETHESLCQFLMWFVSDESHS